MKVMVIPIPGSFRGSNFRIEANEGDIALHMERGFVNLDEATRRAIQLVAQGATCCALVKNEISQVCAMAIPLSHIKAAREDYLTKHRDRDIKWAQMIVEEVR